MTAPIKKIVYVDMDNVLVDFKSGIAQLDPQTQIDFKENLDEVPGIFSKMEPMPGAIEAIERLEPYFDLYILSTAPWKNPSAWSDKVAWIHKHLNKVFKKRMILTHCKNLCVGDYLIDDRGKNGTSEFMGEWILFNPNNPNEWDKVVNYLFEKNNIMPTK